MAVVPMFKYIDNPAAPLVVVNSYHCCIQIPPRLVSALNYTAVCTYIHNIALQHVYLHPAVQELNIMKFSPQATLEWAAQRMHSKVIRLVMYNANIHAAGCM